MKLIVYSTNDTNFDAFIKENGLNIDNVLRIKNALNVGSAYNCIQECDIQENTIMLFVHDDVRFRQDLKIATKLITNILKENPNTIVGLAGTKSYNPNIALEWWADTSQLCGAVTHCDSRENEWISEFGPTDIDGTKVKVVDGLFMAMTTDFYFMHNPFATSNSNDFYDIRACMVAESCFVIDYPVLHKSIGGGCNKYAYTEEGRKFINDFNNGAL